MYMRAIRRIFWSGIIVAILLLLLVADAPPPEDFDTRLSSLVSGQHFDFVSWTFDALGQKVSAAIAAEPNYLSTDSQKEIVLETFQLLERALQLEREIDEIFADPNVDNPTAASAAQTAELESTRAELDTLQPLGEAILQEQISLVLSEEGFSPLGQIIPPVSFHITELPGMLIVSPRDHIERTASISLKPGLTDADEAAVLEERVASELDVSTLVVPLGGLATFPTMIYETRNLNYVIEVGVHEWVHNYLTLRPLGIQYDASPALFTMNETTASIVDKEVGIRVVERFYPERYIPPPLPRPTPLTDATAASTPTGVTSPTPEGVTSLTPTPDPAVFNFRAEMRKTRVRVDELLAAGQVEAAEAYMEERRELFVANGYHIRKLNQAYFAFHGSYADQPGAAGEDPVGPAVVELRAQSKSLKEFLETMAWITSFDELEQTLATGGE